MRIVQRRRWHLAVRLALLASVALVLAGCSTPASAPGGNLHLHISRAFDNRADEPDLWNSGTISADGSFPAAKLDTMDMGTIYDGNDLGTWSATTDQQSGDFQGECNGSEDCHPCTGNYSSSWAIPSVDFTVQERGNGRYVIDLWLGNDLPPKTGGCDPMVNTPVTWSDNLTVTLTGIGSATPAGTADGYTIEVTQ